MFADPQSITVDETPVSLPAVSREPRKSVYRSNDGTYEFLVSHQEGATRDRRTIRVNHTAITSDPFRPSENREVSMSAYVVIDTPVAGFDAADIVDIVLALTGWATESNLGKVVGGES